ncbi:MAG TPA: hypothetical protein VN240_13455, partial [Propylenella sp.]|nr:hypothetical protein [Propylenella sp.]
VESVKEAAGEAGKRLQDKATDISAAAFKEAARGAIQSFTSGAGGTSGGAGTSGTDRVSGTMGSQSGSQNPGGGGP